MRILLLISETGGGHRAAARAIAAALETLAPDAEVSIRDGLVEGGPWPLSRAPAIYAWCMAHARWSWSLVFHLWNGRWRAPLMVDLGYPATARRLKRLLREAQADVIVSTHPLLTRSVARALKGLQPRPPFMVVVTDLVSGHYSWFDRGVDLTLVPTEAAREKGLRSGIEPARIQVAGQPVHPRCVEAIAHRDGFRASFGWKEPVVLFVGGGEGMGNLGEQVRAAAEAGLSARLVVVCGRNERLRAELAEALAGRNAEVHGFVSNLHELMAAADILVTKGGPGSIMEGCVAGLPMLVYDYLPGQETGNVRLVEEGGMGHYVASPREMVTQLARWLDHADERASAAAAARAAAVPDSAERIARLILAMA